MHRKAEKTPAELRSLRLYCASENTAAEPAEETKVKTSLMRKPKIIPPYFGDYNTVRHVCRLMFPYERKCDIKDRIGFYLISDYW